MPQLARPDCTFAIRRLKSGHPLLRAGEQIPISSFSIRRLIRVALFRGSEQVPMCDKCEKLDKKIEHYETIVVSIGDRATVERFMAMIAIYRRKRRRFIPSKSSRPPWRPLSFVGPLSVARNTAPPWGSGHFHSALRRFAKRVSYASFRSS